MLSDYTDKESKTHRAGGHADRNGFFCATDIDALSKRGGDINRPTALLNAFPFVANITWAIRAEPGDTIHFLPTDKRHNVEGIKTMLPEAVGAFRSKMNEDFTLTVETPGLHGIKCTPHFTMGMVMLIHVSDAPANLEAAQGAKPPPKAKERMDAVLAQVAP